MLLFLFALFPLGFLIWCRSQNSALFGLFSVEAVSALFISALFCAFKFFFSPFYRLTPDSFFRNFIYLFLGHTLIPLVIITAVYLFWRRGIDLQKNFSEIFAFYAGFYAVYLPFRIVTDTRPYAYFLLFGKPLLYFFMLIALSGLLAMFFKNGKPSKNPLAVLRILVIVAVPAAMEAFWLVGSPAFLTVVVCAVYCFVCGVLALSSR